MVIGQGPATAMSMTYAVMAQTIGMVMHNGVVAQRNSQMVAGAATTSTCALVLAKGAPSK